MLVKYHRGRLEAPLDHTELTSPSSTELCGVLSQAVYYIIGKYWLQTKVVHTRHCCRIVVNVYRQVLYIFSATECCSGHVLWVGEQLSHRCIFNTFFFACVCVFACLVVAKGTAISLSVCIHMMLLAEPSLRSVRTDRSEILERCFHIFARPGKTLQKANFSYRLVLLAYKHL